MRAGALSRVVSGLRITALGAGALLLLCSFQATAKPAECNGALLGDVTRDGMVSIVDVQCSSLTALAVLLGPSQPLPGCLGGSPDQVDVNCIPPFTVTDVQIVIQMALEVPLSPLLDANGNGCPDACDAAVCGNGVIEAGEGCDDGNQLAGDGCGPDCTVEAGRLSIISPGFVPETQCASTLGCTLNGICLNGICTRGWGLQSVRSIRVEALGLPIAAQTVRVCSNVSLGGAPCSGGGFVVGTAPLTAGTAEVNLGHLPQGSYLFTAEVQSAPGATTWIGSLANPNPIFRQRFVTIDLVAPKVLDVLSLSDVLPPTQVLNAAEQEGSRTYRFLAVSSELGAIRFEAEQQVKSEILVGLTGAVESPISFASDGAKLLQVRARDLFGNWSSPVNLPLLVDTVPPVAVIASPTASPIRMGDSLDFVVQSEPAVQAELWDAGALIAQTQANAEGLVVFADALVDGEHQYSVVATDFAGNAIIGFTDPLVIEVDTVPPQLTLLSPASGALGPDDDSALESGFQVAVGFTSADGVAWRVRVGVGCAPGGTNCAAFLTQAQGNNAAGGLVVQVDATLPKAVSGAQYTIAVDVFDAAGNVSTATAAVSLELGDCAVTLGPLPDDGVLAIADCPQGAPCSLVPLQLEIAATAGCGPIDEYRLLVDGAPVLMEAPGPDGLARANVLLPNGAALVFEAQALQSGSLVAATGGIPVSVDLAAPAVAFTSAQVSGFTTPESGQAVQWGLAADQNSAAPGLQVHLRLTGTDAGAAGGAVVAMELVQDGSVIPLQNISLPRSFSKWPMTETFLFATIPHGADGFIRATVRDAAGNQGFASFPVTVDLVPPAAVELEPLMTADLNPRLPAVTLRWAAPGEDGTEGGPAAFYEIRYSQEPILTAADFDESCSVEDVAGSGPIPPPAAPGTSQEYTLSGPDPRPAGTVNAARLCKWAPRTDGGTWFFAVRASDALGNRSALTSASIASTDALTLRYARVTSLLQVPNPVNLERYVHAVGDVNGDGFSDVAIGGRDSHGFCIVFGRSEPSVDIEVASQSGPGYQCFFDDAATGLGSPVVALGDVNGDGIDDFAAGAGGFGGPDSVEEVRVWLGAPGGEALSHDPALIIRGSSNGIAFGLSLASRGNFNCDNSPTGAPLHDIAFGSRAENRAYVVPGAASWPAPVLDLQSEAQRQAFGVITIAMFDAPADAAFGFRAAFVGDALVADGLGCHELAVTQSKGIGQVVLVRGRPTTGAIEIPLTQGWTGGQSGDSSTVRLLPEAGTTKSAFGAGIASGDFDGDGVSEVLVNHPTNARLHVFRGSSLAGALGASRRVTIAGPSQYDGVIVGVHGWILAGEFDHVAPVGNFDGDNLGGAGTLDLAYGNFDLFVQTYGQAYIRLNAGVGSSLQPLGAPPFEDLVIEEPFPTLIPEGFGTTLLPAGDFNGDGRPDLFIGAQAGGYSVLVY